MQEKLNKQVWFHGVERGEAEKMVTNDTISGMYLVRESRRGGLSNPYTLTIFYNDRVYHLNIRKRTDGLFALGSVKANEMVSSLKMS